MIKIAKGNDIRIVSKGLYEDLFKGMGFAPIEDEVKEDKVVIEEDAIIPEDEAKELKEDEVLDVEFEEVEIKEEQPKKHK